MKKCKNHGERTYVSFSKEECCSNCFKPIKKQLHLECMIKIQETTSEYLVLKSDKILKSFNKYANDYAYTDAKNFMNTLLKSLDIKVEIKSLKI